MRKQVVLILMMTVFATIGFAQAPYLINYQAVAHDATGALLTTQPVTVTFGIYQGSASGTLVWEEDHSLNTNDYGLFYTQIGAGSGTGAGSLGSFSAIGWGVDTYYLKTQIDAGSGPQDLGTVQFVSVPYALNAGSTGAINNQAVTSAGAADGNILIFNGTSGAWEVVPPSSLYSAGAGIDITSGVISNTGDVDETDDHITAFDLNATSDSLYIQDGNGRYVVALSDINSPAVDADGDGWPVNLDLDDSDVAVTFYDADNDPANEYNLTFDTTGGNLVLTDAGGTFSVPLTAIADGVDDADNDPANEYNVSFGLNVAGDSLVIDDGGTHFAIALISVADGVDDADNDPSNEYNTNFGLNGAMDSLIIDDSGTHYAIALADINLAGGDEDATNEYNTHFGLSGTGDSLVIDDVGTHHAIALTAISSPDSNWLENGTDIYNGNSGNVGIGNTTPLYNLHVVDSTVAPGFNNIAAFESYSDFTFITLNANTGSAEGGGVILAQYNGNNVAYLGGNVNPVGDTSAFIGAGDPFSGSDTKPGVSFSIRPTSKIVSLKPDSTSGLDIDYDLTSDSSVLKANADVMYIRGQKTSGPPNPTSIWVTGNLIADTVAADYRFQYQNGAVAGYLLQSDAVGNAQWVDPSSVAAPGWLLSGNSGTTPGTDFLGTTDAQDLDIGINSVVYHRFTQQGQIEFLPSVGRSVLIGESAGENDDHDNNRNIYVGYFAGNQNVSGGLNVAVGPYSLVNGTTANYNVGVGYGTLRSATSGQNTAVGSRALYNHNSGIDNVSIGWNSLYNDQTGSGNTSVGTYAMQQNINGIRNVAIGLNALNNNVSGSYATAVGYDAMANANDASSFFINKNVAVGYEALKGSTTPSSNTGSDNTAVGYQAMTNNTTGSGNVAVGNAALHANTTGIYNTVVGWGAMENAVSTISNVAIGADVLQGNSGDGNTGVGAFALDANNSGESNTAVGQLALTNNTLGAFNVAVGKSALSNNIDGQNNISVGYSTLSANTSGNLNVAVGSFGLSDNSTGTRNSALGYYALKQSTGNDNVGIGYYAGNTNVTGSSNTFIGNNADASANNLINATAIGANAQVGASNSLVLGNNADVGIGTSTPGYKLHVEDQITSAPSAYVENSISSGISGSAAEFVNSGLRSIGHSGVIVNNITTKSGGSNSTKVGLEVNSTGSWGPSTTNQPNVGVKVTASGADENYALQLVDGTEADGAVLTSDASGNASWKDMAVGFRVHTTFATNTQLFTSTASRVDWTIAGFNDGVHFDYTNNEYVAPAAGVYAFQSGCSVGGTASGNWIILELRVNGVIEVQSFKTTPSPTWNSDGTLVSTTLKLNAGDRVSVFLRLLPGTASSNIGSVQEQNWFSGHRVY